MRGGLYNPPALNFTDYRQLLKNFTGNRYDPSGFTTAVTGSGAVTLLPARALLATGATASSEAVAYAAVEGMNFGITDLSRVNFSLPLLIALQISPEGNQANTVRYVQLKAATTHGDLAAVGLGIKMSGLDIVGESYGTARATVTLMTLSDSRGYGLLILHYPGSRIEWWIDGVLKGTQSTAANVPTGASGAAMSLVSSITNGATAAGSQLIVAGFHTATGYV